MTLDSFRERYERELANDLGNLLSRTTAMIARYRDGELAPAPNQSGELAAAAQALHDEIPAALDRWDVTGALDTIWDYVRRLNRHVEQTKPWELAKDPERAAELDVRSMSSPTASGSQRSRSRRTCPRPRSGSSSRSVSRSTSRGTTSRTAARKRSPASSRRSRSSRGSTSPPRRRSVIDTHAHLDALEAPASALDRARAVGVAG